jgi:hypothetical protein
MGIIKEPVDVDFMVESKDWTEAEKEEMRRIIANSKNKKNRQTNAVFLQRASAKV